MPSTTLTLDEVYGGGGNSGSYYKTDYVVLHNTTNADIALDGYTVQYASATSTTGSFSTTQLTGSIAAGGYFLIQESQGSGGSANLSNPDLIANTTTGVLSIGATSGKIALVHDTAALSGAATATSANVVDFIGWGTANTFEGAAAPATSNTTSLLRANDGDTDTDNNAADFTLMTPDATHAPANSLSPAYVAGGADTTAPTLSSTTPAGGAATVAVGANIVLNFSEAVAAGAGTITLTDATDASRSLTIAANDPQVTISGATVTINPTADLHADDSYSLGVSATAFTDLSGNAYAGSADALDFHTAPAPGALPTGAQSTTFAITAAGAYQLAAGATLTETGAVVAVAANTTGAAQTSIDIEGALNGATGQRAIVETVLNGQLTVGAAGSIHTVDGDGFQFKQPSAGGGHANVLNLGAIVSGTSITTPSTATTSNVHGYALNFNAASGGAGAVDHTSGGTITNGAAGANTTALLESDSSDAVRLGANQTVTNYGVIIGKGPVDDASSNNNLSSTPGSTASTYDNSRGIEINGYSHDTIDNFGRIEGAQHGVDAGDTADADIAVVNEVGGVIIGHNGSGVGSDGAGAAAASATNTTVTNSGAIFGEYAPTYDRSGAATLDGDGDGVDIDGAGTVTNAAGATIAGAGAHEVLDGQGAGGFDSNGRANHSEGLSLGGGVVENHGLISGADYGVTVNNDGAANRSGVADTAITNETDGVIVGHNGYAIRLENKGADSLDTDTITNHGTITGGGAVPDGSGVATIEGGGADQNTVGVVDGVTYTAGQAGDARFVSGDGAAIQMGEGADTLINDGTITGTNGHAISLEGGDDTLTLYAEGTVSGGIDGGSGADTLNLTAHVSTHSQILTGVIGVETLHVEAGLWTLGDAETYASGVTIDAGALLQIGQGAADGAIAGSIVDNGGLTFDRSDAVTLGASVSGAGELNQQGSGTVILTTAHSFSAVTDSAGTLDVGAAGGAGAGAIALDGTATLHVEAAALTSGDFANTITGFRAGETLDVGGVGAHAQATLGAGNVLTVRGDAGVATLHLDASQDFSANVFNATSDATDGANITLAAAPNAPVVLFADDFTGFTAAGFAPGAAAASGQLDSNVFRVVGLSDDTNPAFGFTGPMGGDFGRGVITGGADPTTAGVYSPSANAALVLQPTGAELDSNGFIEAHIVNASGAAANPPTLDFDWTYRNSGGRGADLQLSYSTDDVNFTAVPASNFATPAAADATVATVFSTQHEHLELSGLNLAAGANLYLRWTELDSSAGGGSGSRDEVGIDNVLLEAAPAAPVNGTAISISAIDANKAEGAAGASTPFTFTVMRAGDASAEGDVNYAVSGSGAHPADAADFVGGVLPTGTLHFAAGVYHQTLTINVLGDAVQEPTETFAVALGAPTAGAVVSGSAAVGTIQNDDVSVLSIGAVQGAAHTSPFNMQSVTIAGDVTQVVSNGFYVQDAGDGNDATSDGILVFTSTAPTVQVGQQVQVTGTVAEYAPAANTDALTVTQLTAPAITVTDAATTHFVAPVIIGEGGRLPPTEVIASDNDLSTYHPATEGLDFYESLEGMVVTVKGAQAVDATYQGQTWVVADHGAESTGINARGGITISPGDFNPERIQIFQSGSPGYVIGDHLGDVTGVVSYYASGAATASPGGNYELLPSSTLPASGGATGLGENLPRPITTLQGDSTHLAVAAYNVENLDPTDPQARFDLLATDIVTSLKKPDIISLEEVQDADGAGAGTNYSGAATAQKLIASIVAHGGPAYQYIEVAPTANNQNGGEPNGNIRTGFLYNPDRVHYEAGSVQLVNDATPGVGTRTGGDAFYNSRHPIVADFDFNGQQVAVVGVHNYSRGGSQELFGANQPATNSGDDVRLDQSTELANFLVGYKQAHPNLVVAGDFNAYYFEPSLQVLSTTSGLNLTNLVQSQPEAERYSTEFEGNAQQIDNLLVSSSLLNGAQFETLHVNSGQAVANQASDHDPILALLEVGAAPATGGGGSGGGGGGGAMGGGGDTGGGGSAGGVVQSGGATSGQLMGSAGTDSLTAGSAGDTLLGGDGADTLTTGSGHDLLFGNAGDDHIVVTAASQGASVYGGQGNDVIDASASVHANHLSGDLGDDMLIAGKAGDVVLGGDGADTLVTGAGHDQLFGNAGDDHIVVGPASQGALAYGGQGDDVIDASHSNAPNYISGDLGADTIMSGAGFETALGGEGDDYLIGGVNAGAGSMQLLFGNQGNDHLSYAGAGGVELFGGQDGDVISLTATQAGQVRYAFGNLGADTLTATGGADSLYGGQGDDQVSAANDHAGHNYLSGDPGNDQIVASQGGADTLHGGQGADTLTLTAHAAGDGDLVLVDAGDSTVASAADETNLQHVLGFTSGSDHIVLAGHAALASGAGGNLALYVGGTNASEAAAFSAAYTYAFGDGGANPAHVGASGYLAVQESYGATTATYLFTADHHAVALLGVGAAGLQSGDVLAG